MSERKVVCIYMIWKPYPSTEIPAATRQWLTAHDIPLIFAPLLARRGMCESETLFQLFFGRLEETFSSTMFGLEMEKAVARLQQAMLKGERILIFADYDCDGTTGAALILEILGRLQSHYAFSLDLIIPRRFTEGYGLNPRNVERVMRHQPHLVITVDCGISSGDEIAQLKQAGIDCIVTDHHEPKGAIPQEALAILHPQHCGYPFKGLSGCGVAYQFMQGVWETQGKKPPEWVARHSLDLVAVGAICDVMPLLGDNRLYVREGIRQMDSGRRTAFRLMKERLKWKRLTPFAIGYQIGPRINAAGRMASAEMVVQLLLSENEAECQGILDQIESYNNQRRAEQERVVKEGMSQVAASRFRHLAVVQGDYHEGVVGIAASKFAEKWNRPAFVLSVDEQQAKGSARSIPSIHLFQLLERHQEWLDSWGGHAMAAGLTIRPEHLETFFQRIDEELGRLPAETWSKVQRWDSRCEASDLTPRFFETLAALEPYGEKFPPITWQIRGIFTGKQLGEEKKVGRIRIGRSVFPFAMWEHASRVQSGAEQTFFGQWEWSDYWENWQFRALWAE